MSQNTRSHRKLKIAGIVALALAVTLLGFAGNFLFDFALNPQAPYTMAKTTKKASSRMPRKPRRERGLKRIARVAASPQMTEPSLPLGFLPPQRPHTITLSAYTDTPMSLSVWPDTPNDSMTAA